MFRGRRVPEATDPARMDRRKNRLPAVFQIQLRNLGFYLRLELVRCPLEFIEGSSDLPSNFGQFLGPEQDKGKKEEKNHLWEAQVHRVHDTAGGNCQQSARTTQRTEKIGAGVRPLRNGLVSPGYGQYLEAKSQKLILEPQGRSGASKNAGFGRCLRPVGVVTSEYLSTQVSGLDRMLYCANTRCSGALQTFRRNFPAKENNDGW